MDTQRQLERLAFASWADDDCPDADRLAAFILGTLTGNAQLALVAHVRGCPVCQQDVLDCRPPEPRPRLRIARLLTPLLAAGRRSTVADARVRHYVSADLTVDLTITPKAGESWRISGQVRRAGAGAADCRIMLRRLRGRPVAAPTDNDGYFTFANLRAGRYTLTISDGTVQVQVQALTLEADAP